jgi:hypothetical protein
MPNDARHVAHDTVAVYRRANAAIKATGASADFAAKDARNDTRNAVDAVVGAYRKVYAAAYASVKATSTSKDDAANDVHDAAGVYCTAVISGATSAVFFKLFKSPK